MKQHIRAKDYREMAAEIRAIADETRDPARADEMRAIATDYERMADTARLIEESERRLAEDEEE